MLPKRVSDYRTILWVALAPAVVAIQYARPELLPYLAPVSAYLALACGIIAHNHNHSPTFKSRGMNHAFGSYISVFYGYPTFAWIPTHNLNHHKLVNRAGDATITWRYTNKHVTWVALSYFFVSSYFQAGPINEFISKARKGNKNLYRRILSQYFIWAGAHIAMAALAIGLHGWAQGLMLWGFSMALPAFFALWTIMLFNYEQHVHTDPWSKHNHSRSFTSPVLNFLLFNNGYHSAHHENAGTHWSELKDLHKKLEPLIDPALNERSMWWYFFRQYALAPVFPKLGTTQIGRAPWIDEEGRDLSIETDSVTIGEAGDNARMAS